MKTTLRLVASTLSILAAACGGTADVSSDSPDIYEPTPEATPTPEAPNVSPLLPLFTLSIDSVKPADVVVVDLALGDPDGDAVTTVCTAVLTSQAPEFDVSGFLSKISESQYSFIAPITATDIGKAVVRCKAQDGRGGESPLAESMEITIDNAIVIDTPTENRWNICRLAKGGCNITFDADALTMDVSVPDPQIYIPDQVRGAYYDIPHTDFVANVDLNVDVNVAKYSLIDLNAPSIQVTVGTDELGLGYALQITPYVVSGTKFTTMNLAWRWQVVALATNGMTKENLFAGAVLASGNLNAVPNKVQVTVQDGLLQFAMNGAVFTPAIASTNVAGSQLGFSARSAALTFSNATAVLKP